MSSPCANTVNHEDIDGLLNFCPMECILSFVTEQVHKRMERYKDEAEQALEQALIFVCSGPSMLCVLSKAHAQGWSVRGRRHILPHWALQVVIS
jgi:hypothetical protein